MKKKNTLDTVNKITSLLLGSSIGILAFVILGFLIELFPIDFVILNLVIMAGLLVIMVTINSIYDIYTQIKKRYKK